tara:strand:- start:493 stop:633 length:141 start_codon:yes stop_codon:yes gene_type:complete
MPDGKLMKDSEHKKMRGGGMLKYRKGGKVSKGDGCAKRGHTKGRIV